MHGVIVQWGDGIKGEVYSHNTGKFSLVIHITSENDSTFFFICIFKCNALHYCMSITSLQLNEMGIKLKNASLAF